MKKLALILSLLLVFCSAFTACGSDTADETTAPDAGNGNNAGLANPMVDYNSLDEINEIAGVNIVHPGVMGVTDESFSVISGKIAQYRFTLAGYDYCFRASKTLNEEISGIYINGGLAFEGCTSDYAITGDDTCHACRFIVDNTQYIFSVLDNGLISDNDFDSQCVEIRNTVISSVSDDAYLKLVGSYQDIVSERATAEVKFADKNLLSITVEWASSAEEGDTWQVFASIDEEEDDLLVYDMQSIAHYRHSAGNSFAVNDCVPGYFEITKTGFNWSGSGVQRTSECDFERI